MTLGKNRKGSKRFWVIGLVVVVVAGAIAGVWYYKNRELPIPVETERVIRRNITEVVVANGKIQPVVQVVINPEVSGEIIDLPVKEGQLVKKGDVLVKIKPDNYIAGRNLAEANYRSALAGHDLAKANFTKAELEFKRIESLFQEQLVSESQFLDAQTAREVMRATLETSSHQVDQAKASLDRAEDDLAKTVIKSPMDGTVVQLKSQLGERVVGTAMMAGTEIMTVADLEEMEARVDISEIDVVLIKNGQKAHLEVDAFREEKFNGVVYEIANAAKTTAPGSQQEATKFQVKVRVLDKEPFRPGMSVTAEIETRSRTNVIAVPIQSVTIRLPEEEEKKKKEGGENDDEAWNNMLIARREKEAVKPMEVVFINKGGVAEMVPVERGISDDSYVEIVSGVAEGMEVVSGGYKVINRDLQPGKKIQVENGNDANRAGHLSTSRSRTEGRLAN